MAFRRSESPFAELSITLSGMTENGEYLFTSLDDGSSWEGDKTVRLTLPQKRSSLIWKYRLK